MATPAEEELLLSSFRSTATREALRALLLAHQDRIYNICFQVLGRREDAEDAAQESLLRLPEGARASSSAAGLRRWIYRVSLRAALDVWRRRESTRRIETRSAMSRPDSTPFEDPERKALIEAMERLSDGERELIVEHYFEKVPLAELGDRQGLSAVAIWKRIDRAREKLKKLLLGAGFAAASARVADALEASIPVAAPATLVGEALFTRILAGGIVMSSTKSLFVPAMAVIALLCIVGAGGFFVMRSPPGGKTAVFVQSSEGKPGGAVPIDRAAPAVPEVAAPLPSVENPKKNRLRDMLERYKAKHRQTQATFSMDEEPPILEGARELIFEDPKTFLEFIRDSSNEDLVEELIGDALRMYRVIDGVTVQSPQRFAEFPEELTRGFLDILKSGSSILRRSLLQFLLIVGHAPEEFDRQYLQLIHDPDPGIQGYAIGALSQGRVLQPPILERLRQVYESSSDKGVRAMALDAISRTDTEEIQRWMVTRIEKDREAGMARFVAKASLNTLLARAGSLDEKTIDRHTWALSAAAKVPMDRHSYYDLVLAAVNLPSSRSLSVLETALPHAPTPKLSKAVTKLMEMIRSGPSNWNNLMIEFQSLMQD